MMTTKTATTATIETKKTTDEVMMRRANHPTSFNTWFGPSSSSSTSSSGVSSSNTCHNSPTAAMAAAALPRRLLPLCAAGLSSFAPRRTFIRDNDEAYLRLMQQDISFYQSLRTDQSWIRLRKNLEDQQILGFIEWMNQRLSSLTRSDNRTSSVIKYPISTLGDLHDGLPLVFLLECLYKCELKKELKCRMRLHKIRNFETCLSYMRVSRNCECVGIQAHDLVDCVNVKIMLGFLFLIKHDYEYKYLNEIAVELNASLSDEKDSSVSVEDEEQVDNEQEDVKNDHPNEKVQLECECISSNKNEEKSVILEDSGLNMGLEHDESGFLTTSACDTSCTSSNVTMTAVDDRDQEDDDDGHEEDMFFESSSSTSSSVYSLTSEALLKSTTSMINSSSLSSSSAQQNNEDTTSSAIGTYDMLSTSSNEKLDHDDQDEDEDEKEDRAATPVEVTNDEQNESDQESTSSSSSSSNSSNEDIGNSNERPRLSSLTTDTFLDEAENDKKSLEETSILTNTNQEPIEKKIAEENIKNYEPVKVDLVEVNCEPSFVDEIRKIPNDVEHKVNELSSSSDDDDDEEIEVRKKEDEEAQIIISSAGELEEKVEEKEASSKEDIVSEELLEEFAAAALPIAQHLTLQDVEHLLINDEQIAKIVEIVPLNNNMEQPTTISRAEPIRRESVEIERVLDNSPKQEQLSTNSSSVIKIPLNVVTKSNNRGGRKPTHHKTIKMTVEVEEKPSLENKVVENNVVDGSKVSFSNVVKSQPVQISANPVSVVEVNGISKEVVVDSKKKEPTTSSKKISDDNTMMTNSTTQIKTTKKPIQQQNGGHKIAEAPLLPSIMKRSPSPAAIDDKIEKNQQNGGQKIPKVKKDAEKNDEKTDKNGTNQTVVVVRKADKKKKKVAFATTVTNSSKEETQQTNGKSATTNGISDEHHHHHGDIKSSNSPILKYWIQYVLITLFAISILLFYLLMDRLD